MTCIAPLLLLLLKRNLDIGTYQGYLTEQEIKSRKFEDNDVVCVNVSDVEKIVNGQRIREEGVLNLDGLTLKDKDVIVFWDRWLTINEYKEIRNELSIKIRKENY